MASLIPGYKYDIFISYRQKDNKGDRWVSEFVEALRTELESTFKEEISVYFDINPHDGLLETHDVEASLKEKLKCLVFIPIISRTYCDPKSFAWEHEYKAFIEQASRDQFGLKVKLSNGNVANRVLPISIYNLDSADIKLCESILGGILRGVEFIYAEPGVNRPLKPEDDEKINLNKTKYRNQINKVGNAIQEIISGLKSESIKPDKEKILHNEPFEKVKMEEKMDTGKKPAKLNTTKVLLSILVPAILVIAAILIYPKILKRNTLEKLRSSGEKISVAVMPFQNMTNDTTWNVWQDGIQNELITSLTNSEELNVRQEGSINSLIQSQGLINYASITPAVASNISQKLDAIVFIYGSIKEVGKTIRINAQLIDSKTQDAFKSFQIDGTSENILHMIDSLSIQVNNYLIISKLEKELPVGIKYTSTTNSPEAFRYFIYGQKAFYKNDFQSASKLFSQALDKDSNFISATLGLAAAYENQSKFGEAKILCIRLYKKRDQMPMELKIRTNRLHAILFETPDEEIEYTKQLQELDNKSPGYYFDLGVTYNVLNQFDKAIPQFKKALEIYDKWGTKPIWGFDYLALGYAYIKTGEYKNAKNLLKKTEQDFPDYLELLYLQAILSLAEGDTISANKYVKRFIPALKDKSVTEAGIKSVLAQYYNEAGIFDVAEKYKRDALSLEPENPDIINNLAFFLINRDRDINEGLRLVDRALLANPEDYEYLDTKGWGLYKQGKYQEALDILQKSWDLRRQKAVYDHEPFLHLEAAKKAVADQKNNS
jgi:TolB-like protein/Tfp pilus assembly protein PilF